MPRPKTSTPAYLPHKKSGQARFRIRSGSRYRDIYLGPYGSPESWEKYHHVLAEYYAGGQVPPRFAVSVEGGLTIAELLVQYQEAMWDRCHKKRQPDPRVAPNRPLR